MYPGATELCSTTLDDNCNGTINESCPTTKVQTSQCGTTLALLSTAVICNAVANATHYRFRATNGANVQTYTNTTRSFKLTNLSNYAYNTTYTIDVSVELNNSGDYGLYSVACTVTTPALPTTKLRTAYCNQTLALLSSNIYADAVASATQYRFRVTNGANVQTIDKPTGVFKLTELASYAYSTTYTVDVALEINGSFGAFGTACNVSTPTPITSLRSTYCNVTLPLINSSILATPITGATQYRFRVTNGPNVQTIDKSTASFKLTELANFAFSTIYSIDVDVQINGIYSNSYGTACDVTTPAISTTSLRTAYCNVNSTATASIYANTVAYANTYSFKITNALSGVEYYTTPNVFFKFGSLVIYAPGTYSVEVAAGLNGMFGTYGNPCNIVLTAPELKLDDAAETQTEGVVAYPNPFKHTITLTTANAGKETKVSVTDMVGRVVYTTTTTAPELQFGEGLTKGMYNIMITSGDNRKMIKIIKE